jgi:ribosomal protein S18 acetylase RimI-like enzyme
MTSNDERKSPGELSFRPARTEDAETIARFQEAMARETEDLALDPSTVRRGVARVLANPALGHYWLAEAEGSVVASLMITFEWSDWRDRIVWWIQSVWVEPEWRRKRVYSSLYAHLRSLAENDDSVAGIRLYVERRNIRAQKVYERLGMDGGHYATYEWMKS